MFTGFYGFCMLYDRPNLYDKHALFPLSETSFVHVFNVDVCGFTILIVF